MYVLGLKCHGHDTGAALLSDTSGELEICAISEARLNRRKHSYAYPVLSIAYVLDRFGLESLDQVDLVCIDKHLELWPERSAQFGMFGALFPERMPHLMDSDYRESHLFEHAINVDPSKRAYVNHIDAHAASAYFLSGYDDAAVLTVEGGTGGYHGKGATLDIVHRTGYLGAEIRDGKIAHEAKLAIKVRPNIGHLYNLITRKLGLDAFAAGKTMALAAFTDKVERKNILNIPKDRKNGFFSDYSDLLDRLESDVRAFTPPQDKPRDDAILNDYWVNIAADAQETLEEDMLRYAQQIADATGSKNLCLAGGVALSCITNRKIQDSGIFENVFVQPASSDEGIPLGCALWGYYKIAGGTTRSQMRTAYLGKPNDTGGLKAELNRWGLMFRKASVEDIAQELADGRIIARVSGASEYGPRALGNRSILADPRVDNMMDVVNTRVKHRERYRPFAPACHEDKSHQYFDIPTNSPFMLKATQVIPEMVDRIPAIIHVDGSSRVQTVTPEQNRDFYDLIDAFGKLTGVYVLLNTSFNDNGEPIAETHRDAILSFLRTGLDALYIEGYLVERPTKERVEELKPQIAQQVEADVTAAKQAAGRRICDGARLSRRADTLRKAGALTKLAVTLGSYPHRATRAAMLNPRLNFDGTAATVLARAVYMIAVLPRLVAGDLKASLKRPSRGAEALEPMADL